LSPRIAGSATGRVLADLGCAGGAIETLVPPSLVFGGSGWLACRAMIVADSLIAAFRRDGFVVVPALLTDAELERFGAAVDRAVGARTSWDERALEEKTRYEQSFQQCINLWEDHPDVRPLTFHPRIGEAAARLLGVPALRLWHDQALYKEPGGRPTDAHQDQGYWPIRETDNITAWIPFDGSTLESGAMGYVPGSHQFGVRKFVNIFFGEPEDLLAAPESRGVAPVFVEVPRGAVAFHHGLTFHLAKPNLTQRPRRVHTIIYFRDGSTRSTALAHPSVERGGIAVGAVIDSPVTPLAWPRPDGNLPPNPPPLAERMWGWPAPR
jgi:ectoine hydroxylase-related dioxygenase (phytanoyl-CoA dioxygenase family)